MVHKIFIHEDYGGIRTVICDEKTYFFAMDVFCFLDYSLRKVWDFLNMDDVRKTIKELRPEAYAYMYHEKELLEYGYGVIMPLKTVIKAIDCACMDKDEVLSIKRWLVSSVYGQELKTPDDTNAECMQVNDICKPYRIAGSTLNQILIDAGVQYKVDMGVYRLTPAYEDEGYEVLVEKPTYDENGDVTGSYMQMQWTHKGRRLIYRILADQNVFLPVIIDGKEVRLHKL